MELENVLAMMAGRRSWYHRIPLAPDVVTPGSHDSQGALARLDAVGLPADMRGLRVLDVGCSDGFFSFEMERRGGTVLAVDKVSAERTGFSIAKTILNSGVGHRVINVYHLNSMELGLFDLVLFLGVLYHLRNPMLALDRIRGVMKPGGLVFVETHLVDECFLTEDKTSVPLAEISPRLVGIPIMQFYPGGALHEDDSNRWAPNMTCLKQMLEEARFRVLETAIGGQRGYARAEAVRDQRRIHLVQAEYGETR